MKKVMVTIAVILSLICTVGCDKTENETKNNTKTEENNTKLNIVTTIFPQYDFAREIAGDKAEISMLLPPGAESHSYEPTPQDIIKIQNADLFIYVGGEGDNWVDEILESMGDKSPKTLKLMDCVNPVEEELSEGMEEEHDSEKEEKEHENKGNNDIEYDEHVWTSPKNAIKIVDKITDSMVNLDSKNEVSYKEKAKAYKGELENIDKEFRKIVTSAKNKTIIVGDRFPFRYFADEYNLSYYAAFPGCSGETEPSAATIAFLIDKVKTENIPAVFYIEFSNHKVADSIAEATKSKTMLLNSCHNVSKEEVKSGVTYLELMENNAKVLKEALK